MHRPKRAHQANRRPKSPSAPAGPALSTTLKLGGPPECPERPFCLLGLKDTYGLEFAEFVPLDAGGPLTVTALTGGQIDVGLLFTSDPAIATNSFVLLEDDKQLQLADNIVPVVRQDVLDANPKVADILNTVVERLYPGGADEPQQGRHGRRPPGEGRGTPSGSPPRTSTRSTLG